MNGRLNGKVALITGGGVGLGAAFAKRFAEEGAKVIITGRRLQVLEETAATLPAGSVKVVAGDVSNADSAKAMVDAAVSFGGKLDVLVNNAGVDPAGTITEMPLEQWHQIINTNLTGSFYMMRFALPHMMESGHGSVINIASLAAVRCIPAMSAYTSSKAGMIGLTQSAALDYGKYNIRCNVICPGPVRTAMLETAMGSLAEAQNTDVTGALNILTKFSPLPRPGEPDEITGAAVFLASDESSFMTGAVLMLDGGASIVDPCGAAVSSSGTNWGGGK